MTEALAGSLLCLAHLAGAVGVADAAISPAAAAALRAAAPPVGELAAEALSLGARSPERARAGASVSDGDARAWIGDGTQLLRRIEDLLGRQMAAPPQHA